MKPSPWRPYSHSVAQEVPPPFMKPEGSVPCSQEPASGLNSEREESNIYPDTLDLQYLF
jgi:hypothetical protein